MRQDLPTGTVTFVFTDVEGSTRLLHELGADGYAVALAEHRRVIREACARQDGVEVDTQGDAFFFVFETAPDGLEAARAGQEALVEGPIRVRMAVHTGAPLLTEEGYVGVDVHRAARIAAAGHGGQVLVSSSTAALVVGAELRDLGEHRFKDLAAAERVYQLGQSDFPPLKSLYRTNLPVPATPFLGRADELASVVELLRRDEVRLLTLSGPGGTGKTRLALQAAAEVAEAFPDGITWVPLAPLRDASVVAFATGQALGVPERPEVEPVEALVEAVQGKAALLLLDNAEHLLPGVADVIARLARVGGPTVLVTSRERLRVQGEQAWPVPQLSVSDAVELFLAQARRLDAGYQPSTAVEALCARLDHLPLAIELAAARTAVFSAEQLLDRIGERLDLLEGPRDADPRQLTLRATVEWSYDLLDAGEQALIRSLSVFAGGCTFEAAEQVCDATPDRLQALLDKSLVRHRAAATGRRYFMLETIREFAAEQLDRLRIDEEGAPQACPVLRRAWYDGGGGNRPRRRRTAVDWSGSSTSSTTCAWRAGTLPKSTTSCFGFGLATALANRGRRHWADAGDPRRRCKRHSIAQLGLRRPYARAPCELSATQPSFREISPPPGRATRTHLTCTVRSATTSVPRLRC